MPGADGYITYKTDLDNKELEKELAKTTRDIEAMEKQAAKIGENRIPLAEQVDELKSKLDEARSKLAALQDESRRVSAAMANANTNDAASVADFMEAYARKPELEKELLAAQKAVDSLQPKFDRADAKLEAMDKKAAELADNLAAARDKAGGISQKLSEPASAGEKMGEAMAHADKQMGLFIGRVRGLAKRVFIFTVITAALRSLRSWMGKVLQSNDEAAAAVARLKGALLTMVQPLVAVVIPAFITLVNILTRVVTAIAGLVSMLFGKSIQQSKDAAKGLNDEAKAIGATGKAADKASKSMANFDEINQLSGGASGAGGGAVSAAPDFTFDTSTMELDFKKLLNWIKLIGAALLAWKLSDAFLGGLKTFVGLILAINGAILLATNLWDAWQNGIDLDNLTNIILGATLLAAGLYIAFGKIGGVIGMIVGGIAMLATAFHDADVNGWNMQNTLLSIAGIMATGLGISLLTGSLIPALIAGIVAILFAITVATGNGEDLINGLKLAFQGFSDFFLGIFTGDVQRACNGVVAIIDGLKIAFFAILDSIQTVILNLLDVIDEATGGKLHTIISTVKGLVSGIFEWIKTTLGGLIEALKQILQGIVQFLSGVFTGDISLALKGLGNIFIGLGNGIIAVFEAVVNAIVGATNFAIKMLNKLIESINKIPGVSIPTIPLIGGGQKISIDRFPMLAKGAVIPPNREFLAVLGDQKSGTNIETPLSTMVQAFKQALSEGGYGGGESVAYLVLDKDVLGKVVYRLNKDESNRVGVSLAEGCEMSYIKLNGVEFDAEVAISEYSRNFNVLDGENAGRVMTGRMIRDVIGTYVGHKVKVFRRGNNYEGLDAFWDYLVAHSVDDSVMLEAADGQTTISYEAYYTSGTQNIERVTNGVNYWGEIEINFIPMDAQVKP